MKKLMFLGCAFILSFSAIAQTETMNLARPTRGDSQGYFVDASGKITTVKAYNGVPYNLLTFFDVMSSFVFPSNLEKKGSNYFIEDSGLISTVDAHGNLYTKPDYKVKGDIVDHGGSFFIERDGRRDRKLHVVKSSGIIVEYPEVRGVNLRRVTKAGGMYFFTHKNRDRDDIVIMDYKGNIGIRTAVLGKYKGDDVKYKGHNYFIMKDGTLFTVGTMPMTRQVNNGTVMIRNSHGNVITFPVLTKYARKFRNVRVVGGNFFFDDRGQIHTVSTRGVLNLGDFGRSIKVLGDNGQARPDMPIIFGSNYFIYSQGAAFTVDRDGRFHYVQQVYNNGTIMTNMK